MALRRYACYAKSVVQRSQLPAVCTSVDARCICTSVKKLQKAGIGSANLDWENLFFQLRPTHCHVEYRWKDGKWDDGTMVSEPYFKMHIMANVFHYGQALFEGQKAFHCKDGAVRIFNDTENWKRMMLGCARLGMPELPQEIFQTAIDRALNANLDFFPPYGTNGAMYIRPFIFGSGPQLGLGPSPEYTFVVMVNPVGSYYKTAKLTAIPCKVMDSHDRAAPRGVGHVKAAGNYAADIRPAQEAKADGYPIGLYLDSTEQKYVEEFNTSNFVAITADNKYLTPDSGSVLRSITNMCLEVLASDLGLTVERRKIDFDAEVESFREVAAVGTAVVATPISSITRYGKQHELDAPDWIQRLYDEVRAIQLGEIPDRHGWTRVLT
eukprot:gnl/TRDRNA2_/TRDRNA2_192125_c0_seq1.p1 gnl/TRDRNA2_/TRDRNA2_192125_c0~~gnl/TRDRNA2_/TRDRNA2_192125_c0_seq1.p1  ORF type:complete len:381 (+),score=59.14 gnl/TRDRNA2_/TRDRNA2_192125_c0_seq1:87-1229(+)